MKKFLYVTFSLFSAFALYAGNISQIDFEQVGEYKFPEAMLRFNIQTRTGSAFNQQQINEDVKRLFDTGFFKDVVAETRNLDSGDVSITFKLQPKAMVKEIIFEGNKRFSTAELFREININADQPLNDKTLRQSAFNLRKFYRSKGYNEATITPQVQSLEGDAVNVVFKIDENLRLKVNNVIFTGNTVYSTWTLRGFIGTRHSYFSRFFEVGLYDPRETETDKARLRERYWDKGYLDFKVEDVIVTPNKDNPEYVDVDFKLFEGKPYKVGAISISGNSKIPTEKLMSRLSLKSGHVFDQSHARADREYIEYEYSLLGYADFECTIVRDPDYSTHMVNVEFKINEGIPYTVLDVNIKGNKVTKDKVIRRELVIHPGDPADKSAIATSKARLMGMGYFKEVKAISVNSDEYGKKDVNFTVEEKDNFEFKIGGGYSDSDSLVGMVSFTNNNFDLYDPHRWFQGGGQRLKAQADFGLTRYDFFLGYTDPWLFDIPLKLDVTGFFNNVSYDYWDERRIGGGASLEKRVFDDFTTLGLGYKFGQVRVHNMDKDLSPETRRAAGDEWVSTVQLYMNRDTRDSLTNPTFGYDTGISGSISPKVLACSNNFYRLESHYSHYFNFLDKALILHLGAKGGILSMFNRSNDSPLHQRYFLGGGNSLRGFPYREVSPVDDSDHNIGGMTMLLMTAEITHPIWNFIRGAIFVDAGNVGKNSWSMNFYQMNLSAGYGFRINMPVLNAPIRLDLAYPIVSSQENVSRKLRFHFDMSFTWQPGMWRGL